MKNVLKSVRMTAELYSYVSGYRGEGFSEQFSNLVLDALMGEQDRNKRLGDLDKEIARRQEELRKTVKQCDAIRRMNYSCSYLVNQVDSLVAEIDAAVTSKNQ